VLAVQYGMADRGLAFRIGEPPITARNLLAAHRHVYRKFWQWSDAAVDSAVLHGSLQTVFGWRIHVVAGFNARSLRNFPMQANGAEMLRLACCLATERGVEICAPVHDAVTVSHMRRPRGSAYLLGQATMPTSVRSSNPSSTTRDASAWPRAWPRYLRVGVRTVHKSAQH
jgi:hypothetical protein